MQKDNSTFRFKVMLRETLLQRLADMDVAPLILETHGGKGALHQRLYQRAAPGVLLEKNPVKAHYLGRKYPNWRVYETDSEMALAEGVAGDLPITFLDLDPYGSPWPVLMAFFGSTRAFAPVMGVAVQDGLRQHLRMKGPHDIPYLWEKTQQYGKGLERFYLQVCRELMVDTTAQAGYTVDFFSGYYCGYFKQMTHYLAILKQG
jgi:hypothetical protein